MAGTTKGVWAAEIEGLLGYAEMRGWRPVSTDALKMVAQILAKEIQTDGFPETHYTVNDWAQRFFEVRFEESAEKTAKMVRVLTEKPGLSFLVVQADSSRSLLWCSRSSFAHLMANWSDVSDDPEPLPVRD